MRGDGLRNLRRFHDGGDLWVFGYGSLMWRPGFRYREAHPALAHGVRRAPCVISYRHRGSRERPGLVMGLDVGGSCKGRVYRVAAADAIEVLDYLYDREMGGYGVYRPARRLVRILAPGRRDAVAALCFVVDRRHAQYAGDLSRAELIALVGRGVGEGGTCMDYFSSLVRHLDELGIADEAVRGLYEAAGGRGPEAVVDEELRVIGADRLRVAGASIVPVVTGGDTDAPTMTIGAQATALVAGRAPEARRGRRDVPEGNEEGAT